jgi:hypothetical protein
MRLDEIRSPWINDGEQLLIESFDRRTMLDMEAALERACKALPPKINVHNSRTFIARKIIEHVQSGGATQGDMTAVAMDAAKELDGGQ